MDFLTGQFMHYPKWTTLKLVANKNERCSDRKHNNGTLAIVTDLTIPNKRMQSISGELILRLFTKYWIRMSFPIATLHEMVHEMACIRRYDEPVFILCTERYTDVY